MIASDQCIEQTFNREQKCCGGITGFSTSVCSPAVGANKPHYLSIQFKKFIHYSIDTKIVKY